MTTYAYISLFLGFLSVIFIGVIGYMMFTLASREEALKQLQEQFKKLMRSFRELDEQAKLIVRTDLELNRAQAELDKRLMGLNTLQRATRQISQALNETEVYQRLTPKLFEDLGFSKALIASYDDSSLLKSRLALGFAPEKIISIIENISHDEPIMTNLKDNKTLSSLSAVRKTKDHLVNWTESEHFILAPVLTQTGLLGFIFVGNRLTSSAITQADQELITILAGQMGQSIENAQLFEKVFKSSQELEIKVRERTRQLETALEAVEEVSQKKSNFISAVSHELRTPLTSIKGFASLLIAGKIGDIPEAVKERLIKINNHSDNLVNLINNLLDIARIESGRVEMKFASYEAKTMIDNIIDLLTPQITAKNIQLITQLNPQIPSLYIDHAQAERIFINLISNATKFTPHGGTITVRIVSLEDSGYALCQVADTGIGISQENIKKLFSEFFRVDNEINQQVKGTGLGLVLARNIVLAHKGRMWVESIEGKGTTFNFTLPTTATAYKNAHKEIV